MPRIPVSALGRPAQSIRAFFRARPLHDVERAFLEAEFGQSLDLERLRIAGGGHPFGRLGWQPVAARIQLSDACFEARDPAQPVLQERWPVLAHEVLHVWQRVHRQHRLGVSVDGLILGVARGRAAYIYDRRLTDPELLLQEFLRGNIEQQGQIFEDYVRSNVTDPKARDARFEQVAQYVREKRVSTVV
jgi:hypothetical protein